MTERENNAPRLDRLTEALLDDLMAVSDEEIISEMLVDGDDPEAVSLEVSSTISEAIAQSGKAKLALARQEREKSHSINVTNNIILLPIDKKRAILGRFAEGQSSLKTKLTMAARRGGAAGLSEKEIDSILEDLRQLGLLDENGDLK